MANQSKESANAGVSEWTPDAEQTAFRSVPDPNTAKAKELLPDLVEICEMIGATQSLRLSCLHVLNVRLVGWLQFSDS